MPPRFNLPTALAAPLVLLSTLSSGQVIDGSDYNKPSGGPPASYFQATSTMPLAALQAVATSLSKVPNNAVNNYKLSAGSKQMSTIYTDWAGFSGGSAVVWTADMDVDCDGINYKCDGNKDGQALTAWGALSAYAVPFIVIPQEYVAPNRGAIPGNNVAAIICKGKMFYGILGDTNGNGPQVTGEASWLLARTCFPDEDLRGSSGHTDADVTYILFTGSHAVLPSSAMNKHYITDFGALRLLGDRLVNALLFNLRLPGTIPSEDSGEVLQPPAQTQPQAPPPPLPPPSSTSETVTTSSPPTLVPEPKPKPEPEPVPDPSTPVDTDSDFDSASPSPSPSDQDPDPDSDCGWPGHCEDSPCSTDDDCSDDLVCSDGECTEQDGADDDEGTDDDDSVDRGGCGS